MADVAAIKDVAVVKDIAVIRDVAAIKDITVIKNIAVIRDVAVVKDIAVIRDVAAIKDITVIKNIAVIRDVAVVKNITVIKDIAAIKGFARGEGLLNENKVKMMTKMAIYEKNEGRKMIRNAKYYKGDYVALSALKSTITTTIAFIIIMVMIVMCNTEAIIKQINSMDYATLGKTVAGYYVLALIVYAIISGLYSAYQYDKSRGGIKKYFMRLNKLERFYNGQRKRK